MTNVGTGGEAGGVSDADREAAETDLRSSAATGGRPDGNIDMSDEDDESDPTGG